MKDFKTKIQLHQLQSNDEHHNLLSATQLAKAIHPSFDSRFVKNLEDDGYLPIIYKLQTKGTCYKYPKQLIKYITDGIFHNEIKLRTR